MMVVMMMVVIMMVVVSGDDGGDVGNNDDGGGNEVCYEAGEEAATRCDTACQEQPGPGPHAAVARN